MATFATLNLASLTTSQELSAGIAEFSKTGTQTGDLREGSGRLIADVSEQARYKHSTVAGSANVTVTAEIYRGGTNAGDLRVFARMSSDGTAGFYLRILDSTAEVRQLGGAALGTGASHFMSDTGSATFALICEGDQISVTKNGSAFLGPYTTAVTPIAGYAGVGSGSVATQNFKFLSWEAADDTSGVATLTSPTVASVTATAATIGCTSDLATGTLYAVVTTSPTAPTATQIRTGQNESGAAAFYATSDGTPAAGANTFSVTGMTTGLAYWAHFVQDTGSYSNVLSTGGIYPGTYRPASDVTVSGWSVTGAATHAEARSENTASDSEYSTSPTLSGTPVVAVLGLDRVLASGVYTVKYRCKTSAGSGNAKVTFLDADGTTERGNTGTISINSTMTTYSVDVTVTGNAARVKEEIWV
ncbi:MAG: hypothetical protein RL375_4487 [Pseudomonadota bacterium]|jgi:hypothetical protein